MDILQSLDPAVYTWLALICGGLCILGVVVFFFGQAFGFLFEFFGFFVELATSGPFGLCGCLVGLVACVGCALAAVLVNYGLQTCGTPDAINLCRLFGQ